MHIHLPSPLPSPHPPPLHKKNGFFVQKITYHYPPPPPPPPPPHTHTHTHTRPDHTHFLPPTHFFLIWTICQLNSVLVNFLQIDKESESKKIVCVCGGGGWRGGEYNNVQMFQMALLLFKEYKYIELFWNTCLNTEEMAQTSSIYDHFIVWPSSVSLTCSLPNMGTTSPQGKHLCKIIFKSTHKCRSYGPSKLNLWSFYNLTFKCDLDH